MYFVKQMHIVTIFCVCVAKLLSHVDGKQILMFGVDLPSGKFAGNQTNYMYQTTA